MRLIGILNWYDESPAWLAACVSSMIVHTHIEHLVAVDGAYHLLPEGKGFSGAEQHATITEVCQAASVGLTLHARGEPWFGNEVEKRAFNFQLAELVAEPDVDWYFLMDADQIVTSAASRTILEDFDGDVATADFLERFDPYVSDNVAELTREIVYPRVTRFPVRCLFRAIPGLRVVGAHNTYETPDKRRLWGNVDVDPDIVDSHIEIEHRSRLRDRARREQQARYYERRNELGIEREAEWPVAAQT